MDYTLNKLYPLTQEQNEVIAFMLARARAVCAAQTGSGKTYSLSTATLYLLHQYPQLKAVFIVPQKALKAFRKELTQKLRQPFNTWTSDGKSDQIGARITLVTHTSLSKYIPDLITLRKEGPLMCLVDEMHNMQNPNSQLYQQMASIRKFFSIFWGATASPLKNDVTGLYHMINLVEPGYLGTWNNFKYHFLLTTRRKVHAGRGIRWVEEVVGIKNTGYLARKLDEMVIIRQKTYNLEFHYHQAQLTPEEKKRYFAAGKGLMSKTAEDSFAVRMHDLQKVVDNIHPKYSTIELTGKEKLCLALLKQKVTQKEPCLIYCTYYDTLFRLRDLITKYRSVLGINNIYEIHGKIDKKKRELVEDKITYDSVVLVTEAGSESVNLQKANSVIFYDIPFSIAVFMQMVGRITRIDSTFDHQNIHVLESFGTIDTYKRVLIQKHTTLITSLFGGIKTLPLEIVNIDKNTIADLRKVLLWSFKTGTEITDSIINSIK